MKSPSKAGQVQSMFDRLAPSYDRMNRIIALGQDVRWRRFVIECAELTAAERVLDLASGTGDIALAIKQSYPSVDVVAGDFSLGMLEVGRERPGGLDLRWIACDAMNLPFADASFDAVCFAFLLRNVDDIDVALSEIHRVLKPGGRAVCLDTCPPRGPFAFLTKSYLRFGLPALGRMIARDGAAYSYLSESTLGFRKPEEVREDFQRAGFLAVTYRRFMLGTIAVHWGYKPEAAEN